MNFPMDVSQSGAEVKGCFTLRRGGKCIVFNGTIEVRTRLHSFHLAMRSLTIEVCEPILNL